MSSCARSCVDTISDWLMIEKLQDGKLTLEPEPTSVVDLVWLDTRRTRVQAQTSARMRAGA